MTRWQRVTELVGAAIERPVPDRARFLDEACGGDGGLRAEVESLLQAHEAAAAFLEAPAVVALADVVDPAPNRPEAWSGASIGPYRVLREIGRGGMGVVLLAEDTRLGRQVAVKVLSPACSGDAARRERLKREARAAAALTDPGIATVFAFEEHDGQPCLVTEYVRGETLRSEIEQGPLPLAEVIETGIQVARALVAAHAAGIVHRDLKPENIVRSVQGSVKILDFGIARFDPPLAGPATRLTETGTILGTPGYMSPEQLEGGAVDGRSDIFALGVLLYELASGCHPFAAATPAATAARVIAANPPPLAACGRAVPRAFERIVGTCLGRTPSERYQAAADLVRDLEAVRNGAAPLGATAAAVSPGRFSPLWWWRVNQAAAVVVSAVAVYGVWLVHEWLRSNWTRAMLVGVFATAAVNGVLRIHVLFTSVFNADDIGTQLERTARGQRLTDWGLSLLLLGAATPAAREHTVTAALLAALAVGWLVTALVAEQATRTAAFGASWQASSGRRRPS